MITVGRKWRVSYSASFWVKRLEGSKLNLWQIGVYMYLGELKNVNLPLYTCIILYCIDLAFYKIWLLFVLVKTDNTRTQT